MALEFASWEAGNEHGGIAAHVSGEPRIVEVIAVQMRDVQVVGVLDTAQQIGRQLVVTRKDKPTGKERWIEPWVAGDGPVFGFDEDAGMADGCCPHGRFRSGHWWISELLTSA